MKCCTLFSSLLCLKLCPNPPKPLFQIQDYFISHVMFFHPQSVNQTLSPIKLLSFSTFMFLLYFMGINWTSFFSNLTRRGGEKNLRFTGTDFIHSLWNSSSKHFHFLTLSRWNLNFFVAPQGFLYFLINEPIPMNQRNSKRNFLLNDN